MKPIAAMIMSFMLLTTHLSLKAQVDGVQNLLISPKGEKITFKERDYIVGKNAFYLYRNSVYDLVFKNKLELEARIIDIKNDSVYYTRFDDRNPGTIDTTRQDTLSVHPSFIKKVRLSGGRVAGLYRNYRLKKYNYTFETSDSAKRFMTKFKTVKSYDSSYSTLFEEIPYITAEGKENVYEDHGRTYHRYDPPKKRTISKYVVRKGVWFTPSNANEINGLNITLQTMSISDKPLIIRGVNLGADILSMYAGMVFLFTIASNNTLINMPDTIDMTNIETTVHGFHASIGGFSGDVFKGMALNGGIAMARQSNGLVITGFQNLLDGFKGVVISGLRNKSIKGAGLQIGLFNICKHLKGVQIGLWNVNSKRKLPFINWDFRSTAKRTRQLQG